MKYISFKIISILTLVALAACTSTSGIVSNNVSLPKTIKAKQLHPEIAAYADFFYEPFREKGFEVGKSDDPNAAVIDVIFNPNVFNTTITILLKNSSGKTLLMSEVSNKGWGTGIARNSAISALSQKTTENLRDELNKFNVIVNADSFKKKDSINYDSAILQPTTNNATGKYQLDVKKLGAARQDRDAVAIIVGIQNYKRLGKAEFASQDAKRFYEYATAALGIPQDRIKLLIDTEADQAAVLKTFRSWLPLNVNKGKTEVFVFYSGHGLPSQDGKSLYLLPYGVDQDLLEETAVDQRKIVSALQSASPKSVTMFIDSCYSGLSKTGETLLAGAKPVTLKNSDIGYPPEFTVMSASSPSQISSSSQDLQHGIFSFYLMKGMEGDADTNRDGKITVGEMHQYLSENVQRHAIALNRTQEPQLVGNSARVLVAR